jgi:hypothetical protein
VIRVSEQTVLIRVADVTRRDDHHHDAFKLHVILTTRLTTTSRPSQAS